MINPKLEHIVEDAEQETKEEFTRSLVGIHNPISKLAIDFVNICTREQIFDGETSSGHAKYRMPTEDEIIEKAFSLAERTLDELVKRGWAARLLRYEDLKKTGSVGFHHNSADDRDKGARV